ncbi:MAG: hypothetical protein H0W44_10635 [Gammaproteobacteria bacterium]|nr:hypothetical protein [Gammaproteobacteria bacterium]
MLGSTQVLTDTSGQARTTYQYSAYGDTDAQGESNKNTAQYTGRDNDNTGLYYYRARYYAPELKRFISSDPIGLAGGLNTYAYVGGDPVNFTDPSGHGPVSGGVCLALDVMYSGYSLYKDLQKAADLARLQKAIKRLEKRMAECDVLSEEYAELAEIQAEAYERLAEYGANESNAELAKIPGVGTVAQGMAIGGFCGALALWPTLP